MNLALHPVNDLSRRRHLQVEDDLVGELALSKADQSEKVKARRKTAGVSSARTRAGTECEGWHLGRRTAPSISNVLEMDRMVRIALGF